MIIHMETKIVSVFGVLDEAGNVTQRLVVQPSTEPNDPLQIQVLSVDAFQRAFQAISNTKDQLVKQEVESKTAQVVQVNPETK